jgi:polar amino acid transport system substrate-binding protein
MTCSGKCQRMVQEMRIIFIVLYPMCSFAGARPWSEIQKTGTLFAALDAASPPYNYYEGTELAGIEVDSIKEIARRMGLTLKWKISPFNNLLMGLQNDKFDVVVSGYSMSPERESAVAFLTPLYCTGAVLVYRGTGPAKAKELTGKTVAVPVGTDYYEHVKKIPGVGKINTFPSETEAMQNLLAGRAEAWVTDAAIAARAARVHTGLKIGEKLFDTRVAWMVDKKNTPLRDKLNKEIRSILSDGTYLKFVRNYIDLDVRCR